MATGRTDHVTRTPAGRLSSPAAEGFSVARAPSDRIPIGGRCAGAPHGTDALVLTSPDTPCGCRQPILAERGELDREVDAAPEEADESG